MISSLFILGCGRSGTSMLAGLFAKSGYFMGEHLHPPRSSNPKGFFESPSINQLNEDILALNLPRREDGGIRGYAFDVPLRGHRWLARVAPDHVMQAAPEQLERIRSLTEHRPFCYKDPRFCYTLPFWRQSAPEALCICIFRDPAAFISSVFQESLTIPYLHDFAVSVQQLTETWECMYRRVVEQHSAEGQWLFVEYERLLEGIGLESIARFAGTELDMSFPDRSLRRSESTIALPAHIRALHARLQRLAEGP
jgi:Sulfotransferase family